PWRRLLAVAFLAAGVWAVAVAFVDGWHGVMRSQLESPSEYLLDVPKVESAGAFLDSFVDDIDQYVNHVRGHPPGLLLGLWGLDAAGLGGPRWTTALYVAGGAAAVPAVLVAVRSVAGDRRARVLAPFLVLAPATVWMATSADALFAGVAAWAVALVVVATTASEWRATAAAAAGGLLFGVALMLSYGLVLVAAVAGAVAVWRRRWREPLVALVAAAAVLAAFAAVGFSWFDGLDATRREYAESIASTRPYAYFLVANLAALAVATGPATATALSRLRPSGLAVLVAGAGLAVLAADVSGLSKGEVERIWLPFTVWLLAATAVLVGPLGRSARGWLAAQAGLALLVESAVRTAW
ncbi:MAG TPA: hypothetical protein VM618_08185, partial [Acidimicrobiia bacterium]|nr:hypothetical protein [Acidimicrobiia bacterium]